MYQQQLAQNEQGNYTSSATKELDDLMASLSDFKVSPAEEETEHEWNNEKKKNKIPRNLEADDFRRCSKSPNLVPTSWVCSVELKILWITKLSGNAASSFLVGNY